MQLELDHIEHFGASVLAISPETPETASATKAKNDVTFEVLSDTGNKVAARFGLVFRLPEDLRPIYASFGIDIPKANGDESFELPVTATYVIDMDGKIRKAFLDADYTKRLDPEDIILALKNI